jgi:hypothetical protein
MEARPKVEILFLSKEEVESLINVKDAVYAAEEAYRALGEGQLLQRHPGLKIKGSNIINTMPAYIKSRNLYGMKQVNVYYEREPGDNLPRIWGSLVVLTNPDNALPYAILDGTSITNMRTAGGHAVVAAKYLARKDSKTLAIIGCGAEARTGFKSLMNNFKLEIVKVYDIRTETMASFISEMNQDRVADKWVLGTHEGDGELIDRKVDMFPEGISKGDIYADMGEIVTRALGQVEKIMMSGSYIRTWAWVGMTSCWLRLPMRGRQKGILVQSYTFSKCRGHEKT